MMFSALKRLITRGVAVLINAALLLSLFSLYTISATAEEEYDRPWLWPVPGSYQINSLDTYTDGSIHNQGQAIDIGSNGYRGDQRLDVVSSTDGTVHYIQKSYNETTNKGSGWGNYVVVKTADFYIVYAHLKSVLCKYGEIKAGDVIGKMGTTGNSTGVHLHVQAYPIGQSSNSTDIYVFDKFINNPIYAPKFRFWAGLHSHSNRYGEIIQKYYKNVDETYYVYSGGRDLSFEPKSLGAEVTAVRVAGTRVYSQPLTTSSVVRTIDKGTDIEVFGYYIDAYGKIWYKLCQDSENEWVCETEVGFKDYVFSTEYTNVSAPDGSYGTFFDLHFDGTLSSRNKIQKVIARILRDQSVISECEIEVNSDVYDIDNAFYDKLKIDNMSNGNYTYEILVTESASFPGADPKTSTYTLFTSSFVINSLLSDTVPPLIENITLDELDVNGVKLGAIATDNVTVSKVTFTFKSVNGAFEKTFDADVSEGRYFVDVNISELSGSGQYVVTGKVSDSYGNTDQTEITVNIPENNAGELWIVTDASPSLRIRSGPGTSYDKLGSLYNGDKITVTEVVVADGHAWGKFGSGWTALTYCTYDSGYMHSLTFNLCGGSADMNTVINKKYGNSVTIPDVTPTRSGYKFLGWSTSPNTSTVSYKPGETYSANASIQLYAVWSDTVKPVISSVSSSITDWTRDRVGVIIQASDDSGVVYYTFDGGLSWRRSNTAYIFENTVFDIGDIGVKDGAGNVTYYNVKHEVSNIDTEAPVMPEGKPNAIVNGSAVTFNFSSASDALSGIEEYKLVYSKSADLSDSITVDVSGGTVINFEDGVYYARLYAYDKAGNSAYTDLNRFLIGEACKLNTPSSFRVKASSGTETVFSWDNVENADGYTVLISVSSDMSSPITLSVSTNEATTTELESGITYYALIYATCSDDVYLTSDSSETISFITVSNDSSIHSMFQYSDAVITEGKVNVVLHNSASTFNMEVVVHEEATVEYFSDKALTEAITVLNESFISNSRTVYVKVTAEDGTSTVYELTAVRAERSAQAPSIFYTPDNIQLFVNDEYSSTVTASVSDGGVLSVTWYAILNNSGPVAIGEGSTVNFKPSEAGRYEIYAVVLNTNEKCQESNVSSTSEYSVIVVNRRTSVVSAVISSKVYDGHAVVPSFTDYVGDGNVTYKFYTDSDCTAEIQAPSNAGKYYLKAFAEETNEYSYAESTAVEFTISKALCKSSPVLSTVMPVLRDRNGYVTVLSEGVEYSLNGQNWIEVSKDTTLTFAENDTIQFRVAETTNYLASDSETVTIVPFSGTDSFTPNGSISMTETVDGYLIVDSHKLTYDELLLGLAKTENVYVVSPEGNALDGYVYTSSIIIIKDEIGVYKSLSIIILGDVDLDGAVTESDKLTILELSNGVQTTDNPLIIAAADLDGDGVITSIDSYMAHLKTK